MSQAILETKDPAALVDAFFTQQLPQARRSETKLASGTGVVYLLPLKDGVSRSVAITPTSEDKTLVTYGKVDDATSAAAAAIAEKAARPASQTPETFRHRPAPLPGGGFANPGVNGVPPPPAGLNSPADAKTAP